MPEFDLAAHGLRRFGIRCILNLRRHIEILEDAREHRHRANPVHLNVQQLIDRHVHPAEQRDQNRDLTDCQCRIVVHHDDAADQINQHRADAREGAEHHAEPSARHALADVEVDHFAVDRFVALVFAALHAEQLDKKLSADRQRFIQDAVDLVAACLRFARDRPAVFARAACRDGEQRYDQCADQGENPVFAEHQHKRCNQCDCVREDACQRARDDLLHAGDVARHARDDVPLIVRREESLRHRLQVPVHRIAHVKCDVLRDPCVEIALENADQVCRKRHAE